MADMTPTQAHYLAYIHAYTQGFGLSPSEGEIAKAIGVSPPSANQMVKTLEKKGLIRRKPGVHRSIEILIPAQDIPKWKGGPISRQVWEWTREEPPVPTQASQKSKNLTIYRFKIVLKDTNPLIWRQIEVNDVTIEGLHLLIQTAMGWTNSHLHLFEIGEKIYSSIPSTIAELKAIDSRNLRISDLVRTHGPKLRMIYEYDFGDGWRHDIILEKVSNAESGATFPQCIGGERACPPEDVGGTDAFEDYVEAITDPDHPEHAELLDWKGPFDPEKFDPKIATRRMKSGPKRW